MGTVNSTTEILGVKEEPFLYRSLCELFGFTALDLGEWILGQPGETQ